MKYLKVIVPLAVLAAVLLTALPAFAGDPWGGPPSKTSGNGSNTWEAMYVGDNGCYTGNLAAGSSVWFKADAWSNKHEQIWLDDELPGAKAPSGSAVFTVAKYMQGKAPGDPKWVNAVNDPMGMAFINGFAFSVYDHTNLVPNYKYPGPNNMWFLTAADGGSPNGKSGVHGWGVYNKFMPQHLLWYEGNFNGFIYIRVFNQMLVDGTFTLCTYRDNL
jgi:hypothetical protein